MDATRENDVYITGIAGYFPDSDSVKELGDNLFNKIDLISEDERRWKHRNPEIPRGSGKVKSLVKFDASFFGIDYKNAHRLEPMNRLLLERVYESIIDAGINPRELRNTNTAVIVGVCIGDTEHVWYYEKVNSSDCDVTTCSRCSIPVFISNWLGLKGPSFILDAACSSSHFGMEQAYKLINDGLCDAAIICGTSLIIHECTTLRFVRLGVLSADGRSKSFDERANGYARSESIVSCFLQKAKDSRRVHAQLVHSKSNCDGYKEQGISYPEREMQRVLLSKFYQECGVSPSSVEFVEAHGTGTIVGDPEELSAIDKIFCTGRNEPLMIGSIRSNLGHAEAASGLTSIAKLCIAYNTGYIPPNLHFKTPRQDVPALIEGRLQVVTEKKPWNRGLAGCNSFGFGGANAHVLLKNVARTKVNNGLPSDNLPRLVCVSGRTESAVAKILDDLESRPIDVDEIRLWHAIHEQNIEKHYFRGYSLLQSTLTKTIRIDRDIQFTDVNSPRPVWFTFSSLESKWSATALQFMKFPIFADAVQKCKLALEKHNFDLYTLLNSDDEVKKLQKNYWLIGNVVVHIGLTDALKAVGIKPDKTISLDHNELSCAYADGLLTAEETILAAYNTCLASEELQSAESLKEEIPSTEFRSEGLASIAVPQRLRQQSISKQSSAEFYANNIKNPNLLTEVCSMSPFNGIVINIGMAEIHDIIFNKDVTFVKLIEEGNEQIQCFFTALGKLFEAGHSLILATLYPQIAFPVPQATPLLSHLVEWDHRDDWLIVNDDSTNKSMDRKQCSGALLSPVTESTIVITPENEFTEYLSGHMIDGRIIYPATGYLVLVWQALASMTNRLFTEVSVVFQDVYFQRATNITKGGDLKFTISILRHSGRFEVLENNTTVVTGCILEKQNIGEDFRIILETTKDVTDPEKKIMSPKDLELNLRDYNYKGLFRGVRSSNVDGTYGTLMWQNNWVTFLDTMMQVHILANDTRSTYVVTRIEKISIDVDMHHKIVSELELNQKNIAFRNYPFIQTTRCGGVEICEVHVTAIAKRPPLGVPVYEKIRFVPNYCKVKMALRDVIRANIQLIFENVQAYKFKTIELVDSAYKTNKLQPIIEKVGEVLGDLPLAQAELLVLCQEALQLPSNVTVSNKKVSSETNSILFIGANLLTRSQVLNEAFQMLKHNGFVLTRENTCVDPKEFETEFQLITIHRTDSEYLVLLRRHVYLPIATCVEILTQDYEYSWIDKVKKIISEGKEVVLYSQNEPINGLLGLVNCLRKEPGGENVFGFLIADPTAPTFDPSLIFYKHQLIKRLAINVYQDGQWGTYRNLLLDDVREKPSSNAFVKATVIGDLSSLRWLEGPLSEKGLIESRHFHRQESSIFVYVHYSALNFRDVMTATGRIQMESVARDRLAQECVQGIEVSGKTSNGTRVMAICDRGITNLVQTDKTLVWCIPDEWSLAEAATIPVAYSTVYLALVMVGKIRQGESILIHAGSGAVGQAAINVALHYGLEVFTTVGSPAKRAFIKRLFPQIKDSHIGNSRDTSFEDLICIETNGKGVNLVLNSLADDKLQASVKCLSCGGRFLEIGKYDIFINTQLETCFLKKGISFHGITLDYLNDDTSVLLRQDIRSLLMSGIASGAVRPITFCSFEKEEVESAFRYMAAGKYVGKIVIKILDEEYNEIWTKPSLKPINAVPRYNCNEDGVYILIGGLGGFGLELADWLVIRGARKLMFSSSRGVSNGYQALRIRTWKTYGIQILISTCNIASESGCESLLKTASAMGPVRAIFNLAVRIKDALFQNQTPETFRESFEPKGQATVYLDKFSRKLCPELRDFVVFSSVTCGRGNAGQTNYGYSNSVMERVCEERKKLGLPALAIQWGAIGDVGLLADMQKGDKQLEIEGTLQQRISSCLQSMDRLLKQDDAVVSSFVVAEKKIGDSNKGAIVEAVAQILGITDLKTVSQQVPLSEMGMDSMMAVEIKQTLERDYDLLLSAQEIRMLSFAKLVQLTAPSREKSSEVLRTQSKSKVIPFGLEMVMKIFGDEKTASEPYIYLPTLEIKKSKVKERDDNNVLFLLPGLDNCAETFRLLCSKLHIKSCVLQLGITKAGDSLEQLTDQIYQNVIERLSPGANFYLLGYSFGTLPVLKLASRLESEGYKGVVFCLDGSPDFLAELANNFLETNNDTQLQNDIIAHLLNMIQIKVKDTEDLAEQIKTIESVEDKLKCVFETIPIKLDYSFKYLLSVTTSTFNRVKLMLNHSFINFKKISSPIVLLRQKTIPKIMSCGENYGLDKFTTNRVTIHYLHNDHSTIVDNPTCAEIINNIICNSEKFEISKSDEKTSENETKLRLTGFN